MRQLATFLTAKGGASKGIRKHGKALLGGGAAILLVFASAGDAAAQTWIEVTPPDDPLTTADDPPLVRLSKQNSKLREIAKNPISRTSCEIWPRHLRL